MVRKPLTFFGKRGLSWHGGVSFYSCQNGGMKHIFIDQIVGNNAKQEKFSVLSFNDAALARLKL